MRAVAAIALFLFALLASPRADASTVVLWHAYRGAEQEALDRVIETFRAAHPGDTVEVLALPFDAYASKLEAAIPHGHGPDVFLDAHERLGDYRDRNLVAPVDFDPSAFDDTAVAAITLDGKRYAIPLALKCLALYLRGDKPAPSSLDALRLRGRIAYEASNAYGHAPILHAFGGRILDPSGRYAFADGPAEKSLAWVLSAQKQGAIPEETSGALVTQMFASGAAEAAISGPWLAAELPRDLAYRVVPIPPVVEMGEPSRPFLTVEGVMLAPAPRDPALANALARHLASPASAVVRARIGRQVVATKTAWDDPQLASDTFLRGFALAAREALPMPTSPMMRAAWEPTTRAIQKVLRGDLPPREAMEEAGALGKTRSNHLTRYLHQRRGRTHRIEAYLLQVAQTASPREPQRNPTWFLPTEAKLRLSEGRGRHSAAELCRVVDHAVEHLRSRL
ncbi:MAG: extracellular solute-binding protein [Polyangiales bacterium]